MDCMKILVANLGSTSFKYRLFDMTDETVLARGGVERIGSPTVALLRRGRRSARGDDRRGAGSCRGGAAVPGAVDRSERRCLNDPVGAGGHRLQGGACPGRQRRAARR